METRVTPATLMGQRRKEVPIAGVLDEAVGDIMYSSGSLNEIDRMERHG